MKQVMEDMKKNHDNLKVGRIMIVDDEAELMTALCEALADKRYETRGFTNGADALKVLVEQDYDLLLADLMMPEMDGIALLQAGLEIDPNLVCIIMTGHGTVQTAVEAMKKGAFDYVLKPFKLNTLMPILSRAMEVRSLRQENIRLRETVAIHELGKAIAFSTDLNAIMNKVADAVLQQCASDEVSIMLPTQDGKELYIAVARGGHRVPIGECVSMEMGIAGWVARNRETVIINGKVDDPRFSPVNPRNDIRAAVSMPMMAGGNLIGVLNVNFTQSHRHMTLGQVKALSILVSIIAPVLENTWLNIRIHKAEEEYRSIFENAHEGIYRSLPGERFLTANPALARIFGYDSMEDILANITDITRQIYVNPDDAAELARVMEQRGEVTAFEFQAHQKNGSRIWISASAHAVRDEKGVLLYHEGTIEDITERKQIEENLRKSEENFRCSLEDSPLGVRIATAKGETIYANKAFLDIYGYESIEEFNGIPIKERYTPQSYAEFQLRIKARDQGDFGPSVYEINSIRKNGKIRHLQVLRKEILWNGTKQFQIIYQDITERKQAEETLRESREQFRIAQDMSPDGFTILQPVRDARERIVDFTWVYENAAIARLNGTDPEAVLGKRLLELFPSHRGTPILRAYQKVAESGETCIVEVDYSGESMPKPTSFRIVVVPMTGNIAILAQDITERKRAEESLRASLVEKEVLLKEVHHRVKNNLMIIIGLIKMQEAKADNKMFSTLLLEIEGRVRAMALVHESLHKSADLAHVDLQNYIETMSSQIRVQFGAERDIRFSVQGARVDVNLDIAVPCGLILNELITNSYKHAFPGDKTRTGAGNCEIAISVKHEGKVLRLSVADNGVGLPADLDLEKSETLGLRLIKMLSQQINGSIELDRSAGTAFRLKFPIADKIH